MSLTVFTSCSAHFWRVFKEYTLMMTQRRSHGFVCVYFSSFMCQYIFSGMVQYKLVYKPLWKGLLEKWVIKSVQKKAPFANLANIIFERELVKLLLLYYPVLDSSPPTHQANISTHKNGLHVEMKILKR